MKTFTRSSSNKGFVMKTTLPFARRGGRLILLLFLLSSWRGFAQTPIPPFAAPPVRITSPANHATFYAPVDIPIFAYARLPSLGYPIPTANSVTNVEFFASAVDLGSGVNLSATNRPILLYKATPSLSLLSSVYCFVWTNAPVGSFALTAVATSSSGLSRTSAPVNITILATATNTNPTDIVSIDAIDPVAIAGTNAYVWRGVTNATPTWTNWSGAVFQWFTNWGPKNATFAVKRLGDASSDLTVNYSIGGTASNGVDYAALPGFVTVPAGSAYALIPIVPIDTGTSNVSKTVVLTLTPSTNTPPDYIIGFPPRAAALIWENWLRPPSAVLPDGSFHVTATGPDGAWFYVQYSTDLVNWSPICTNQVFQGSIDFVDPDAPSSASRFYRAVPVANAPSQ
jgi:hypothetical protein